jgi:ATP-dependent RNA helicase DHX57
VVSNHMRLSTIPEGRRKEEGGRRKEEGGRRKEEGGRRKEEGTRWEGRDDNPAEGFSDQEGGGRNRW